jgi:hypothetical protein
LTTALSPRPATADQGGVSFWLPGLFGSLTAVPATPGWSWANIYIHTSADAGGGVSLPAGGQLRVGIDARADIVAFGPTYTFATPVLGGQAAINVFGVAGHVVGSADAILNLGGVQIAGNRTDTLTSLGDVLPMGTLKWNRGVHNYMIYVTGNIPVGAYSPSRLANLGLGHAAIDAGGAYTYYASEKGHEFSIASGFTYNFENAQTNYQNGIDWHLDWAASQFISKQVHVGIVGYLYNQLTDDSGSGAVLGPTHSRVAGIGPQIGYLFPINDRWSGYLNLKGYWEFAAQHRAEGWNVWLTLGVSPAAHHQAETKPRIVK